MQGRLVQRKGTCGVTRIVRPSFVRSALPRLRRQEEGDSSLREREKARKKKTTWNGASHHAHTHAHTHPQDTEAI